MNNPNSKPISKRIRRAGKRLFQAATLALLLVLNIPSGAEDRAIKLRINPVYPEIARRMRIEGIVVVSVTVDADGKVTDVKPVSGNRILSIAAVDAVHKWRFAAGDGAATFEVSLNFDHP